VAWSLDDRPANAPASAQTSRCYCRRFEALTVHHMTMPASGGRNMTLATAWLANVASRSMEDLWGRRCSDVAPSTGARCGVARRTRASPYLQSLDSGVAVRTGGSGHALSAVAMFLPWRRATPCRMSSLGCATMLAPDDGSGRREGAAPAPRSEAAGLRLTMVPGTGHDPSLTPGLRYASSSVWRNERLM
jgi:hypothetical protein